MSRPCLKPNGLLWFPESVSEFVPWKRLDDHQGDPDLIRIPCNSCINCRIRRGMEWKIRGIHQAASTFHPTIAATLTYSDAHIPKSGTLDIEALKRFHKRLRHHFGEFSIMACGEYGPNTGRAHYHAIYFGLELPDLYKGAHWASKRFADTWGMGNVSLHLATPQSIGYVAGYVVKKLRAPRGTHPVMETVDGVSGLVVETETVSREFLVASKNPGIGRAWIEQFAPEVIRDGFIVMPDGRESYVIPGYYIDIMRTYPGFEDFQARRRAKALENPELDLDTLAELGVEIERDFGFRSSRTAF